MSLIWAVSYFMNTTRKPIGKKLRFDIFKRDSFKCQYCGNFPPNVMLEIDHIVPIFSGGTNEINNLITSCFDCNRGKSKHELNKIPNSLLENIDISKEKLKQYKQFKKINDEIIKNIKIDIDMVDSVYNSYFKDYVCSDNFRNVTIKSFIDKLGVYDVIDSMNIACSKYLSSEDTLKYFCGICYNKIKNL